MPLGDPWDNTAPGAIPLQWTATVVGTANVTISTALVPGQVIDSYTLVAGDVVLLIGQSTASQNGLYVSAATPLRHPLFDDNTEVGAGIAATIVKGTVGAGKEYELITPPPITVGTTALTFAVATPAAATTLPATIGAAWDNTAPVAEVLQSEPLVVIHTHCASTANVSIASLNTGVIIDSHTTTAGSRVLLTGQTAPAENGIWQTQVSGGGFRYSILDQSFELEAGTRVINDLGTGGVNTGKIFVLITPRPIVIGTTALTFVEDTAAASPLATPFNAFDNTAPVPRTV